MQEEREPTSSELDDLDAEAQEAQAQEQVATSLDDLFEEAEQHRPERKLRKPQRSYDPALREALAATAKKMREIYTNPDNWKRTRGIVLIDKETQTVVGNYSEYIHNTIPGTRILRREHQPIQIDAQEVVEGYLGRRLEEQLRGVTWDREVTVEVDVLLDEVQVECPKVKLKVCLEFNSVIRADLVADTQFASMSGNVLLKLPQGTNIWEAAGVDTKAAIRKAALQ